MRRNELMPKRNYTLASSAAGRHSLVLCLIPCRGFFEPNYESGKTVRWSIGLAGGQPTAIAGLWRAWDEPDGTVSLSVTMLALNANWHS